MQKHEFVWIWSRRTKPKKIMQRRFQVKNTEMQMVTIKKSHFAESDGIASFPYGHLLSEFLRQKKE